MSFFGGLKQFAEQTFSPFISTKEIETVDPVLKKNLEAKGQLQPLQDQTKSLAEKQHGVYRGLYALTDFDASLYDNNPAYKAYKAVVGTTGGTKVAASGGATLAMPYIKKQMDEIAKQQEPILRTALVQLRDPKISKEEKQNIVKMIAQVNPDIVSQIPDLQRTGKEIYGDAAQLALTATLGLNTALSQFKLAGFVDQAAIKELTALTNMSKGFTEAERVAKYGPMVGKIVNTAISRGATITKDFLVGLGFGASYSAAEGQDTSEMTKEGLFMGGLNVAIPIGLEGAIKGTKILAGKAYGSFIGPMGEKIMNHLESLAVGPTREELETQATNATDNILAGVKSKSAETFTQKAAQKAVSTIQWAERFEQRWVDRFAPMRKVQEKILENKGIPLAEREELYYRARLADGRAGFIADDKLEGLFGGTGMLKNDDGKVMGTMAPLKNSLRDIEARWVVMDQLDRANSGLPVTGGKTVEQLNKDLADHVSYMTASGKEGQVQEGLGHLNTYFKQELASDVQAGLITQEAADAMLDAHPNYLPHSVVLSADEQAILGLEKQMGVSGSMNVADNAYKKALGSLRDIQSPYEIIEKRQIPKEMMRQYNSLWQSLAETQKTYGAVPGMRPLQTAEMAEKRSGLLQMLGQLNEEKANLQAQMSATTKVDNTLVQRMRVLEKDINDLNIQAVRTATSPEEAAGLKSKQAVLETKTDYRPVEKATEADKELQIRTEEKVSAANKDIRRATTEYNQAQRAYEESRVRMTEEDAPLKFNKWKEAKDYEAAQEKLEQLLSGKAGLIKAAEESGEAATKVKPKVSLSMENKGVSPKAAIEQQFAKKNQEIESLKKRITLREQNMVGLEAKKATSENLLGQMFGEMEEKKNAAKQAWQDLQSIKEPDKRLGEETISFFNKGVQETWVVPHDIATMAKNLDAERITGIMKVVVGANNWMKKFATSYNVFFAIPNILRDKQTAMVTADAFIRSMAEQSGAVPRVVDLNKKELLKVFEREGGVFGSVFNEGRVNEGALLNLEKAGVVQKLKDSVNILDTVKYVNEGIEESTRLNVFRKALEAGLSGQQAAIAARDATIDFSKMGYSMRNLNQVIPFLNARVQGLLNIPKAMLANPENFARMMMWSAAYPSMGLYQHNRQFKSYANWSNYYKNKYWIIQTGEQEGIDKNGQPYLIPQGIFIPKGEIQTLIANPIQYFLEKGDKLDNRTVGTMLADTLGSMSPLTFQGFDSEGGITSAIMSNFGPLVNITAGLATNKNLYSGQAIIPESRLKATKDLQFNKTTPQVVKTWAGLLGIAPAKLEFVINSMGGVPQDLTSVINVSSGLVNEGKLRTNPLEPSAFGQASQLPGARRFLRESTEANSPDVQQQRQTLEQAEQAAVSRQLKVKDRADEIFQNVNRLKTSAEKKKYMADTSMDYATKKALYNRIKYAQTVEVLTPSMSNEVRARYIYMRINEMQKAHMDGQEIGDYLKHLADAKLLNKDVLQLIQQIRFLGDVKVTP